MSKLIEKNSQCRICEFKTLKKVISLGSTPFANAIWLHTIADFFSYSLSRKISENYGRAKVVIANNTVAHINDLHDMVKGVRQVLETTGVFIFEVPYLIDMFKNLAFDSIYHEH